MYTQVDKAKENRQPSHVVANSIGQNKNVHQGISFVDNRPETVAQMVLNKSLIKCSSMHESVKQLYIFNFILPNGSPLQHGSTIETFTGCFTNSDNLPNGPAWFSRFTQGTPFYNERNNDMINIHAAARNIGLLGGHIYVHKYRNSRELSMPGFTNHIDAIHELLDRGIDEQRIPDSNNTTMAGLIQEVFTEAPGYEYDYDLVRGVPEIVIFKPHECLYTNTDANASPDNYKVFAPSILDDFNIYRDITGRKYSYRHYINTKSVLLGTLF